MDKLNAFEIFKNSQSRGTMLEWIKDLLIVDYAEVAEVYDVNTVKARLLVQPDGVDKTFIVRLLHPDSSKLLEKSVQPKVHDQVLLLFLRTHNDEEFLDPEERAEKSSDGVSTVITDEINSYNLFSGVGILAPTIKGRAPTSIHYDEDSDGPFIDAQTSAKLVAAFKSAVSVVFDVPLKSATDSPADAPVSLTFGRHSPLDVEHRADVAVKLDKADVSVTSDSAVSVKADKGFTLDAGGDKTSIKNNSASLIGGLDDTLTDCTNLVSALNSFSGAAAQASVSAGAASSASLAAAIVALMVTLSTALAALQFSADKSKLDSVLK